MLGLPAKVALLGGSVSLVTRETAAYDAGWASFFHKWLELAFTPCGDDHPWPRECLPDCLRGGCLAPRACMPGVRVLARCKPGSVTCTELAG